MKRIGIAALIGRRTAFVSSVHFSCEPHTWGRCLFLSSKGKNHLPGLRIQVMRVIFVRFKFLLACVLFLYTTGMVQVQNNAEINSIKMQF